MPTSPVPVLTIERLVVRFPGLPDPVLDIPALTVDAGEGVAVTGPSGSGKTTFVNIIAGLATTREGRVRWNATDLAELSERRRDQWRACMVGVVMQDIHLFPGLSALENVLLPARLRGRADGDTKGRAIDLLARVGVPRPDQAAETLSRGQAQRVAVARALLQRPRILIADEPTASLDASSGKEIGDLLLEIGRDDGTTLIVVSHDEHLIARLGRRLHLSGGRLAPMETSDRGS